METGDQQSRQPMIPSGIPALGGERKGSAVPRRRPDLNARSGRRFRAVSRSQQRPSPAPSAVALMSILALVLGWIGQILDWTPAVQLQTGGVLEMAPNRLSVAAWVSLSALVLLILAGLLGAVRSGRPRVPMVIPIALVTMLTYGMIWVIIGLEPAEYRYAFGTIGPLVYAMCIGVYAGLDPTLWRLMRPLALAIAYGATALGAFYTVRLSLHGYFVGPTPMNQHVQTAFWFALASLALCDPAKWRWRLAAVIPMLLCVPMAVLMGSRSLTLLALLGLAAGGLAGLQSRSPHQRLWAITFGMLVLVLCGVGLWLLWLIVPENAEAFLGRFNQDTRTSQYVQFFQQVPILGLISGLGPKATYTYNDLHNYNYIDNQFLFILFKFGLPIMLGYVTVVIWPGWRLLRDKVNRHNRVAGWFFVLWTLATLGVSIFHNIGNNPQNLLCVLMAGRCFICMPWKAPGRRGARSAGL